MSNIVKMFQFEHAERRYPVRVVEVDGRAAWVAKDVCDVLGHSNSRMALDALDSDEKGVSIVDTLGGPQEMAVVFEPGLYSLILRSRKPQAKVFKRFVTHEILPQVRQTGNFIGNQEALINLIGEVVRQTVAPLLVPLTQRLELVENASRTPLLEGPASGAILQKLQEQIRVMARSRGISGRVGWAMLQKERRIYSYTQLTQRQAEEAIAWVQVQTIREPASAPPAPVSRRATTWNGRDVGAPRKPYWDEDSLKKEIGRLLGLEGLPVPEVYTIPGIILNEGICGEGWTVKEGDRVLYTQNALEFIKHRARELMRPSMGREVSFRQENPKN